MIAELVCDESCTLVVSPPCLLPRWGTDNTRNEKRFNKLPVSKGRLLGATNTIGV